MPDLWDVATVATQFALYLGVLAAAGVMLCAALFRLERYRGLAVGFALTGLVAAGLSFALKGAALTGDASGMTDPEMLGLLWDTSPGVALGYRIAGLGLIVLGACLGQVGIWVAVVGAGLAVWSFNHVGHIAARDDLALDAVLIFHLAAVAFWIGILAPLRRLVTTRMDLPRAADVSHLFGRIASLVVPALIVAGGTLSYYLVGSVDALVGTGYGQSLLAKVGLVALLLGLAAANKLRFAPALMRGDERAAAHLATSITLEWAVVCAILLATAVLTTSLSLPT